MNIKNRLDKVETRLNIDSEFCRCERELVTVLILPSLDRQAAQDAAKPEPEETPICERCGKPEQVINATFTIKPALEAAL